MNDGQLPLMDYWKKYREQIENDRGWLKETEKGLTTLEEYSRKLSKLAKKHPEVFLKKPMDRVTLLELMTSVEDVRADDMSHYSISSKQGFFTVLHIIYRFAHNAGHALNPFAFLRVKKPRVDTSPVRDLRETLEKIDRGECNRHESILRLRKALEGKKKMRRSLSPDEIQQFLKIVWAGIKLDGRFCGLALGFYLGTRPGETRAIRWEDIIVLRGKNGRDSYFIRNALGRTTEAKGRTKTDNGFRKIPEHCELHALIRERHQFIVEQTGEEPTGYVCCPGNEFGKPCSYYEYADFAEKSVFRFLDDDFTCVMAAELVVGQLTNSWEYDEEDTLTLYCLRHTFYTWLAAFTPLNEMERAYVMGHEMKEDDKDIRSRYNDDDLLEQIGDDMDKFICLPDLHPEVRVVLGSEGVGDYHFVSGVGVREFSVPMRAGETIVIDQTIYSDHPGTETLLRNLSKIKGQFDAEIEVYEIKDMGEPDRRPKPVSLEADQWDYLTGRQNKK